MIIVEGDEQRETILAPDEQAANLCNSSCDVNVDDGPDLYEVAANDALSIENGEWLGADEPSDEPTEDPIEDPIGEPNEPTTEQ